MTLEALSSNEFLNFIIYDTISASPSCNGNDGSSEPSLLLEDSLKPHHHGSLPERSSPAMKWPKTNNLRPNLAVKCRKKRRRRPRVCKNKEEAETQRMTHITVERNRRKQMNEHLSVLRSLMPESYVQRGDQASVVGGAIDFVKELEHILQTLEAKKLQLLRGLRTENENTNSKPEIVEPPFAQFFVHPQYTWSQIPNKYTPESMAAIADIEVTLIETHASLRILSRRSPKQLSKMVSGFQALHLTIIHLNVTTMDPLVLYSISVKVEERCQLSSVDDIAGAVHHVLRIIEEEASLL